ncbi:MAG TPA: SDR family NAD(P)-dependent oxidoreductase [Acidimicrobiales bacterium]|nr:SDR family NAD(P)-dependent oxidoreductase [Acidimicrobiales bacterium]
MVRIFVTGSTTGLGLAAAGALHGDGHEVILHARDRRRASAVAGLVERGGKVVVGDLATRRETGDVAEQVNAIGGVDAVIHNAAVYVDDQRVATPDGHARTLAVNVIAPYLLTSWITGPSRLIYLSSGMHTSGDASLDDLEWRTRRWSGTRAYCDSKLHVTAMAFALARRWPEKRVHAVNPGWVPTRMGGPGAPDDLELGHRTQAWLAVTDDPGTVEPGYWYHQRRQPPAPAALDHGFQDALVDRLAGLTGVHLDPGVTPG